MKYVVTATYVHRTLVDTESKSFQDFQQRRSHLFNLSEKEMIEEYAQIFFGYSIIDDEGHGTLTPLSFDWMVEEEKNGNTK